jgi:hypothetical protein
MLAAAIVRLYLADAQTRLLRMFWNSSTVNFFIFHVGLSSSSKSAPKTTESVQMPS